MVEVLIHKGVPSYCLDCSDSQYQYLDKEDLQDMIDAIISWECSDHKEEQ